MGAGVDQQLRTSLRKTLIPRLCCLGWRRRVMRTRVMTTSAMTEEMTTQEMGEKTMAKGGREK
jgi:hypothetical protein